jgi:hypothetical protein
MPEGPTAIVVGGHMPLRDVTSAVVVTPLVKVTAQVSFAQHWFPSCALRVYCWRCQLQRAVHQFPAHKFPVLAPAGVPGAAGKELQLGATEAG